MQSNQNRAFRFIAALILSVTVACGEAPSSARTYRIGMVHWAAYASLNVADVKGFWAKRGLKVEVVNYVDNTKLNSDLHSRNLDLAEDMIGSWVDLYTQGVPLTVLGETDWSFGGDKIILKNSVSDLNSLKGQHVGLYLNLLSTNFFVAKFLDDNGLKFSDFTFDEAVGPDSLADDFVAGKYNLMLDYDPAAVRAVADGQGRVVRTSRDYPGVIPEGMVARTDHLRGIPYQDLVKIFEGWIEGVKWKNDPANWVEFQKILNEKTFPGDSPNGSFTEAELREFLNNVNVHDQATQLARNQTGGGLYQYLSDASAFMQKYHPDRKPFLTRDVFDNTAIVQALKE